VVLPEAISPAFWIRNGHWRVIVLEINAVLLEMPDVRVFELSPTQYLLKSGHARV
jgi:hypothetical protein